MMWSQILMAVTGVWLMAAPGVMEFDKPAADNAHIVGPLIVTFSLIATSEATRNVRWACVPLAIWLLLSPWVIGYDNVVATINDSAVAVLTLLLCLKEPRRQNRFGGGWPGIWQEDPPHWHASRNRPL